MAIGQIQGIAPGAVFASREELHKSGIHRATQAGITGPAAFGAESIVMAFLRNTREQGRSAISVGFSRSVGGKA